MSDVIYVYYTDDMVNESCKNNLYTCTFVYLTGRPFFMQKTV